VTVLVAIALAMTVGVYGLVAAIVKLDDLGLYLHKRGAAAARAIGAGILRAAPWLMKGLSVAGTIAMFLVGGSILEHGVPALHHAYEAATADAGAWRLPLGMLFDLAVGAVAGGILVGIYAGVRRARGKPALPA
jgi:predicted DNA repair protein MutK